VTQLDAIKISKYLMKEFNLTNTTTCLYLDNLYLRQISFIDCTLLSTQLVQFI